MAKKTVTQKKIATIEAAAEPISEVMASAPALDTLTDRNGETTPQRAARLEVLESELVTIRHGLVAISDRVGEMLVDKFLDGTDHTTLQELFCDVWSIRQSLGLFGGLVKAEVSR